MPSETILVVEDELGPRESLNMILRPYYKVESVDDGVKSIALLQRQKIDLVTLDIKMPGPSGIETLKQIKGGWPHIEVLVVTGYGTLRTAMDAIRYGACDCIMKPFDINEVLDAIRRALARKKEVEELRSLLGELTAGQPGLEKRFPLILGNVP